MPGAAAATERLLSPLDAARALVLRGVGRPGRALLRDRELRVGVYGVLSVLVTFALTCLAPVWLLAIGPLVLGVPHLVADVRYLVARQGLHRRAAFWALVALPIAIVWIRPGLTFGLVAIAGAAIAARAPIGRRLAIAALAMLALLAYSRVGWTADVIFAHAHNVIAVLLWWRWAPRRRWFHRPTIALAALGGALVLGGAIDGVAWNAGRLAVPVAGIGLNELAVTLSPVADPTWSLRLVLFFAFAQSIHYAVWLRLVPEDDRPRAGIRSYTRSVRALVSDIGWPLFAIAALASAAFVAWGLLDAAAARDGYLRLALFHGPLELAVVVLLFLEGRAHITRRTAGSATSAS